MSALFLSLLWYYQSPWIHKGILSIQPGTQEGPRTKLLSLSLPLSAECVWPRNHSAPCKRNSSLLYLSVSMQGQNHDLRGLAGRIWSQQHCRSVHLGASSRLLQSIWQLMISVLPNTRRFDGKRKANCRETRAGSAFLTLSMKETFALCSESLFSYHSLEGPRRAQSWGRATQAFIAAGDVRHYCGWRMG